MQKIKTEPTKTVLIITVGFLVVFLAWGWRWALIVALIIGLAGAISKKLSEGIHKGWMELARLLSYIVPNLLLSAFFYLFLFPVAALARLFSKNDPLSLKNKEASLFRQTNKAFSKESFENPW